MRKNTDVPNLGEFIVEGYARRVANSVDPQAQTVPVVKVSRGRETFTVMLQDYCQATPNLDRLFKVGDTLEIRGLQLRDLILASTGGITVRPTLRPTGRLTTEDVLAFLHA